MHWVNVLIYFITWRTGATAKNSFYDAGIMPPKVLGHASIQAAMDP